MYYYIDYLGFKQLYYAYFTDNLYVIC